MGTQNFRNAGTFFKFFASNSKTANRTKNNFEFNFKEDKIFRKINIDVKIRLNYATVMEPRILKTVTRNENVKYIKVVIS